ncbi:MAG: acetylxylan esterase [Chloroflexaceae bacterium]
MAYFDLPLDQLWSYCPPQTRQPDCAQFWRDTLAEAVQVQIRFPDAPPRTGTPRGHPGHSGPGHAGAAFVRCRRVGWNVGRFAHSHGW